MKCVGKIFWAYHRVSNSSHVSLLTPIDLIPFRSSFRASFSCLDRASFARTRMTCK